MYIPNLKFLCVSEAVPILRLSSVPDATLSTVKLCEGKQAEMLSHQTVKYISITKAPGSHLLGLTLQTDCKPVGFGTGREVSGQGRLSTHILCFLSGAW